MKLFRLYALLLWAAVPLLAVRYWVVWNEMPATLVTRFDPEDLQQPTAFTTRIHTLEAGLISCTSIAVVAWAALNLRVRRTFANLCVALVEWTVLSNGGRSFGAAGFASGSEEFTYGHEHKASS
ncbi:MAG TPA: hypothetical protein VGS78_02940 [Candidatus Sulfotelmatobacter sp.]|nr:hypothetical protein [Candidatus Sulfotelmatobacter sp.]